MVVARLEIAGTLENEVEPGVKRQLLQEVVVKPGTRLDPYPRGPVERQPNREPGLSGGAQNANLATARAATGEGRSSTRASVSTNTSSSTGSSTVTRIASG